MKGNVKKKLLIAGITIIFSLLLFSFTMQSNADTTVVGTWDVSANDGTSNVTATLYSDCRFVISGTGMMKDYSATFDRPYDNNESSIKIVEIQSGVTSIGNCAFGECTSLSSIEIPSSVTSIGNCVFWKCTSLSNIVIPSSVMSIGSFAFNGCTSLSSIKIPSSVTCISSSVFSGCTSLSSIKIPSSVTSIGSYAFEGCTSLSNIVIPSSVTSIGSVAFGGCTSLSSINVDTNNQNYDSENGILFNKDNSELVCYPAGKEETKYTIQVSVTSIGEGAFWQCTSLSSIEISSSVTSIGDGAFGGCTSLSSIEIPSSVTSIGMSEFVGCTSLSSIEIPSSVTSIGDYAFKGCASLSSIEVPSSVTSIGDYAFKGCTSLSSIKIPSSVTSIGMWEFDGCTSLSSIEIPSSVTSIGYRAFYECTSLSSIEIPSSVTSIGQYVFSGCTSLSSIKIPSSVTSIGDHAFSGCTSLSSIEIPSSVTSIQEYTFYECTSLSSIEIPSSVTSIGDYAFYRAELTMVVATGTENVQEIELPDIIKRAMKEEDILYTANDFTLTNCSLSEDKTKLVVDTEVASKNIVSLRVTGGALGGLTVVVVPSGTITYSTTSWTKDNVTARIYVAEGETIQNNDGKNTYTFTENGTFTFQYLTAEGEEKEVTATVENIDKTAPTISSVAGNPIQWTKENVTLTVTAQDTGSGLASEAYSFDGGVTWQAENTKTYTENTNGIVIKVRDKAGNITTYDSINITKIDKTAPTISSVAGNPTQWTKENVTLTVTAQDTGSGLASEAYSFDGGTTWQASNQKTYTENTNGIVIKVKDKLGNIATYDTINITKIEKLTSIIISKAPIKTTYIEGENFSTTGMVVRANYNSQNTQTITNYTITDGSNLKVGKTSVTISYTENGVTKTRTQAITVEAKLNITISGYETTQENGINYIEGIKSETTIQGVLNNIETNGTAKVYKDTTRITDGNTKAGTGMTIKISLGTQEKTYTLVVTGDLNGDGQMGNVDLLKLVRYNAELDTNLSGAYLKAADIYKDGEYADNKDILKMARVLANLENL